MKLSIAPLFSGSGGNATYIGSEQTKILIDAGVTGTRIRDALEGIGIRPSELDAILVTHEHIDHIKGVGVLSRKYDIPVYANEKTWLAMRDKIGNVAAKNVRVFDGGDFFIKDMNIEPFSTYHDAADPVGYSVYACGEKLTLMTDTGRITKRLAEQAKGSSAVVLESNHDVDMLKNGSYPFVLKQRILSGHGHLSNDVAAKMALYLAKNGARRIVLAHLSRDNNTEALAYDASCGALTGEGCRIGGDVELCVAKKDCVTGLFHIC